jgi:HEAT repeat protein
MVLFLSLTGALAGTFTGALACQPDTKKPAQKPEVDPRTDRIHKLIAQLADNSRWGDAARKPRRIGEPAVKPLLAAIQEDEDGIQDTPLARRVLETLGSMGPAAEEAYSELFEEVGRCEPKIYIRLLSTLADLVPYSEAQGNQAAVQTLVQASMGTIQAMGQQDRRRWSSAYQRFAARVAVDPDAGLEAMIDELKRSRPYRREVAAEVLGRMGKKATSAIPALSNALRGGGRTRTTARRVVRSSRVRGQDDFPRRAAEAMIRIAPRDARCAVAYGHRLKHANGENERAEAALRIGSFGEAAKGEVRTLIAALRDKSQRVRCETVTALGMIGPDAKAAIPKLRRLSESDNKALAVRARAALRQIVPQEGG